MELWYWHPIFVHFTVALLFTASVLFIISHFGRGRNWQTGCINAATWIFWIGIAVTLFTATTGLIAYFTVPNIDEETRSAINKHFMSALITVITYLVLAFFLWSKNKQGLFPGNLWILGLVIAVLLLINTAYLGGDLVFRRGVGTSTTTSS
jgi:uncharacterized membrane protein